MCVCVGGGGWGGGERGDGGGVSVAPTTSITVCKLTIKKRSVDQLFSVFRLWTNLNAPKVSRFLFRLILSGRWEKKQIYRLFKLYILLSYTFSLRANTYISSVLVISLFLVSSRPREHAKQPVSRSTRFVSLSVRPPSWISPEQERGLDFEKVNRWISCVWAHEPRWSIDHHHSSSLTQDPSPAPAKSKMAAEGIRTWDLQTSCFACSLV